MESIAQSAISSLKEAGLGDVLYIPGQQAYEARQESYWALTSRQKPWAFVQPRNTDEVSKIVKVLVGIEGCKFAIRRLVMTCPTPRPIGGFPFQTHP